MEAFQGRGREVRYDFVAFVGRICDILTLGVALRGGGR